jgi:hypothetical protein
LVEFTKGKIGKERDKRKRKEMNKIKLDGMTMIVSIRIEA